DNIRTYVEKCHLFGVKVYVTFNTQIKNAEFDIFEQYVEAAAKANVDAFIVTDLGTLDVFKKYDIPLHGSTQIGVHNLAGAKVLEELGFSRIVLARETLLEDISKIKNGTSLEIEYFVHGALCVSFSGGCLASSMMNGDSGNRGRCNQPCRLKYTSTYCKEEKYLLSTKDQCLIDKLNDLHLAGVDSLKIEGRLKQPHYVGSVVEQYRKAVDNLLYGNNNRIDYSSLKRAYNRGNFTQGYNYENTKQIIFDKINGNIGEEVGKIIGYDNGALKVRLNKPLNVGDGVKVIKSGRELGGFCINDIKKKGDCFVIKTNKKYDIGSGVCLTLDKSQVDRFENVSPKLSIKLKLEAIVGERLKLMAACGGFEACVYGEIVEAALSKKTDEETVKKQLLRLGESEFSSTFDDVEFVAGNEESCFIPLSQLNSIRRIAVEELRRKIINDFENKRHRVDFNKHKTSFGNKKLNDKINGLFVEIDGTEGSLKSLERLDCKINLCLQFSTNLAKMIKIILENDLIKKNIENIFLKLPRVARGQDYDIVVKTLEENRLSFDGIVADNLYGVYIAKALDIAVIGGIGLNVYNSRYSKIIGLDGAINSVELNRRELVDDGIIFGYGKLAIMTLLHCPVQANTGCDCADCKYKDGFSYYDKRGEYKIERIKVKYCQFELYNQQIVDVRNKISLLDGDFYINLSGCAQDDIVKIVDDFSKKSGVGVDNSTYGHLFRGVK
ncbi:MAG: U32 family peptidase, partial [Clostridia bacterium]|nr:U32 family peptidase [Clostridia bacterium]